MGDNRDINYIQNIITFNKNDNQGFVTRYLAFIQGIDSYWLTDGIITLLLLRTVNSGGNSGVRVHK